MSYSSVSFLCASHMCPSQYTTGLADGFYLCAIMVLGVSFVEHMVLHIRNRVMYTMEKEEEDQEVQEVQEVQEPEPVQEVQEHIQKVIQDIQEFIQEVQEQPKEVEDDSEISTPRHKMRRLQI